MNIEVVLTETDPKLGKRGQVVKVSPGYAQNFLFPHHKAVLATAANRKTFEFEEARRIKDAADKLAAARLTAEKIGKLELTLEAATGPDERMFGSVTAQEIASALSSRALNVEKRDVHIDEPIKKLGQYEVTVKLHPEIHAKLKLWVVKKKS